MACFFTLRGRPRIFSTAKNRSCPPSAMGIGNKFTMQRLTLMNPMKKSALAKPRLNMRLVTFAMPMGPVRNFGETSWLMSCRSVRPIDSTVSHEASSPFPNAVNRLYVGKARGGIPNVMPLSVAVHPNPYGTPVASATSSEVLVRGKSSTVSRFPSRINPSATRSPASHNCAESIAFSTAFPLMPTSVSPV